MAHTKALLLMNLGSPDSTAVKDVRRYLNQFLMDPFVLDFPALFRFLLVRAIITPFRSPKSAEAYEKIWRQDGSPLIVYTSKLKNALQQVIDDPVCIAMRYGNPSVQYAFDQLLKEHPGIKEVVALPLYPHYTMSSFETAVAHTRKIYEKNDYPFRLKFISPFYNHPDFLASLAAQIRPYLQADYDKILFSYHGLPERHMRKDEMRIRNANSTRNIGKNDFQYPSVTYQIQCRETSKRVAALLDIPDSKYESSFQSRLTQAGSNWIKPYTVNRLEALPGEGVKKLLVVCPAFTSDCLETLEEIAMAGQESFIQNGGVSFTYIPCLNDSALWVEAVAKWFREN